MRVPGLALEAVGQGAPKTGTRLVPAASGRPPVSTRAVRVRRGLLRGVGWYQSEVHSARSTARTSPVSGHSATGTASRSKWAHQCGLCSRR
ncbi:hypothetical protein BJF82_10280 [Kytococcus sp. CUA-901]|nr:hypothetical protein BJF82_10280 [Kytococcus sp. CUA-901]